jgi:hypothetical protein
MQNNLVKDALYYLTEDCNENTILARGVMTGLVTGLMAAMHRSFEDTIAYLKSQARPDVRLECIPESWREEWLK